MSKANALKDKITNKKGSPARAFINAYANEESEQKAKEPAAALENKKNKTSAKAPASVNSNSESTNEMNHAGSETVDQDVFSVIDELLEKEKNKPVKEYVGFYLDADVHEGLNELCKKSKQKWVKSKIVNDILRSILEKQGFIKSKQI